MAASRASQAHFSVQPIFASCFPSYYCCFPPSFWGTVFSVPGAVLPGVGASGLDAKGGAPGSGALLEHFAPEDSTEVFLGVGCQRCPRSGCRIKEGPPIGRQNLPSATPQGQRGTFGTVGKSLTSPVTTLIERDHGKRGKVAGLAEPPILPWAPPPAHAAWQLCSWLWFEW